MIGRLTGTVVERSPDALVLDVGGVGYRLQIPLSTYYALSRVAECEVTLRVHTHVREDTLALFGFSTAEEQEAFESLIAVAGVGPRLALAVLSGIGAEDLERAIRGGDRSLLERIPGIGRKTAERILIDLRDRYERRDRRERRPSGAPGTSAAARGGAPADVRRDAYSALVHLGYSREAADNALDEALGETGGDAPLEAVLRAALRRLTR